MANWQNDSFGGSLMTKSGLKPTAEVQRYVAAINWILL